MTTRTCSAKIILALWLSALALPGQQHRAPKSRPKPAAKPTAAPVSGLLALVRDYRQNPTIARHSSIVAWAAAHPKDAPLAHLALGIAAYEQKDFPAAIAALQKVRLPLIADYSAYYLAAAQLESGDNAAAVKSVAPAHSGEARSPLAGKSWLVDARARQDTQAAETVRILREHYADLPQPDGDLTLAGAYQAAGDLPQAAEFYQGVFYQYPVGDASTRAAAALVTLKDTMGAAYPKPLPQQMLRRADRLLELRDYVHARSEYESIPAQAGGLDRDRARVRIGASDYQAGKTAVAYPYLRDLDLRDSEADAERLFYLQECARRLNDEDEMMSAVKQLGRKYPRSPWRLKALLAAAGRYVATNRPGDFVPLYKAAADDFPDDVTAPLSHWRIAFQAYFRDKSDADRLLREHLRHYPAHSTAAGAIYFLGRHAEQRNDPLGAAACYRLLSTVFQNYYYGVLGRDRLRRIALPTGPAPSSEMGDFLAALKLTAARPIVSTPARLTTLRIERSRILRSAGLNDFADAELRFGARIDGQPALLAMEIAGASDAPHQAMRAMKMMNGDYLNLHVEDAPRQFWDYLFPLPYRADLAANARDRGLDPYLVAALIRQESEFNPGALSRANAYGLTQVRPVTGREFARRAGIQRFTNRMLFEPSTNLKLGTLILRSMLDRNSGNLEQTLAAYNAGPSRAAEWVSWNTYREPAEFVESIPFTETRDYVQAVIRNADIYRRLYPEARP
jgi:soluble lytic murein transglycosylase